MITKLIIIFKVLIIFNIEEINEVKESEVSDSNNDIINK